MQYVQRFLIFVHLILIIGNCNQHGAVAAPTKKPRYLEPQISDIATYIEIKKGKDAILHCEVTGMSEYHTVSWVRSADIKVLTVGGLVFSSDPRMTVTMTNKDNDMQSTCSLRISQSIISDSGEYKCQVNTEPTISRSVKLNVKGSGKHVEKNETFVEKYVNDKQSEINIENDANQQQSAGSAPTNISELKTSDDIQSSILASAAVLEHSFCMENNATESKHGTQSDYLISIIVPLSSLIVIVVVVIILGTMRLFFSWKLNPRGESRQSRSRSVTLERRRSTGSLKSSGSRRSRDSVNSNTSKRSRRKDREDERKRESIYYETSSNGRLSPLEELKEPTPQINNRKPIFLIVRVDNLEEKTVNDFNTKLKKELEYEKVTLNDCVSNEKIRIDKLSVNSRELQDIGESFDNQDTNALETKSSNNSCASLSRLSCSSTGSVYVETNKVISIQKYTI